MEKKTDVVVVCGRFSEENDICTAIQQVAPGCTIITGRIVDRKIIAMCDRVEVYKQKECKGTSAMDIINCAHVFGKPIHPQGWDSKPRFSVALCGSYKFIDKFLEIEKGMVAIGNTVYIPTRFAHIGRNVNFTPETERMFDELHRAKMRMADQILVVNPGGYIGEDTLAEIKWAISEHLEVTYLEAPGEELIYG